MLACGAGGDNQIVELQLQLAPTCGPWISSRASIARTEIRRAFPQDSVRIRRSC
jgi:hypothetical protein